MLPLDMTGLAQGHHRHGSPNAGISLASATESRGGPVRQAVSILEEALQSSDYLGAKIQWQHDQAPLNSNLAAWRLVGIWVAASFAHAGDHKCSIAEAEQWFHGAESTPDVLFCPMLPLKALWMANQLLQGIVLDSEFHALLPYIFEQHGPGSRDSVRRDPSTAGARAAKRQSGIFYTPSDVADFMVRHAAKLCGRPLEQTKAIDPAVGTGVFLLALLREAVKSKPDGFSRLGYVASCLHGIDISGQALDSDAFMLLIECLEDVWASPAPPVVAWRRIRQNLIEANSLLVEPTGAEKQPSNDFFDSSSVSLAKLFPLAPDGFDLLIGNPPYAAIGTPSNWGTLTLKYESLRDAKLTARTNLYPLFIEMMWQMVRPGSNASALVVPLSIAFHGGSQYEPCRYAKSRHGGKGQFAFFDREPHALFGEEVKTRNAILFRSESEATPGRGRMAEIETGPLRKWTSRTRSKLFEQIDFTPLDSTDITGGIPKIGGVSHAEAFLALRRRSDRLSTWARSIGSRLPSDAFCETPFPSIFVGGTAYNFLNVYRPLTLPASVNKNSFSESPLHCLEFNQEDDAAAAFAVLSSRVVFWLWHSVGDGFHVSSAFLKSIPFTRLSFSIDAFDELVQCGVLLWQELQEHRFVSLNGGRQTIGFRPLRCHGLRDRIDAILSSSADLATTFSEEIRQFVQTNAVVDSTDERRNHVAKHFDKITV